MMNYYRYTAFCATMFGASSAFALVPLFDGEIGVSLDTSYGWDSNINANSAEQGDDILYVTPGVSFVRQKGLISMEMGAGVTIQRYDKTGNDRTVVGPTGPFVQGGNNSTDPFAYLNLSGINNPSNPLTFDFLFNFARVSQANNLVGRRTTSYNFDVDLDSQYKVSDKFGVGFNPFFGYQDYQTSGFNNPLDAGVAIDGIYYYSEKLEFNAGYRYTYMETNGTPTFKGNEHTLFVGAVGQLMPKVEGVVEVGVSYYDSVSPSTQDDFAFPYADIGVNWFATEQTTFNAFSSIDISQSPGNQLIETYAVGAGVSHHFLQKFTANAGVSYEHLKFDGNGPSRKDDAVYFDLGVDYDINDWAYAGVNFEYQINDSTLNTFQYNRAQIFGVVGVQF